MMDVINKNGWTLPMTMRIKGTRIRWKYKRLKIYNLILKTRKNEFLFYTIKKLIQILIQIEFASF